MIVDREKANSDNGLNLLLVRRTLNMSQEDFSKSLNIEKEQLDNIEKNIDTVSNDLMLQVTESLKKLADENIQNFDEYQIGMIYYVINNINANLQNNKPNKVNILKIGNGDKSKANFVSILTKLAVISSNTTNIDIEEQVNQLKKRKKR